MLDIVKDRIQRMDSLLKRMRKELLSSDPDHQILVSYVDACLKLIDGDKK